MAGVGEDPAHLRALRLLHGDLPDLSAARRRARFARAGASTSSRTCWKSDKPAIAGGGQAYRPLPLLPLLHDDLPVGRALHAPRRSCPRLYRGDLSAALERPPLRALPRRDPAVSRRASGRRSRPRGSQSRSRACWARFPFVGARLAAMLDLAPAALPPQAPAARPRVFPAAGSRKARVALLDGCAQPVLEPAINEATIRLLNRLGVEVVLPKGEGCCGALVHHMGREASSPRLRARATSTPGRARSRGDGLDAIVITASGCGTTIKDYGFMFRDDAGLCGEGREGLGARQGRHANISQASICRRRAARCGLAVAYHSACSMQHGQKITDEPKKLLAGGGLHREGRARGPYLLRLGRRLQHPPAGDRRPAARPQGRPISSARSPTSSRPATSAASPRSRRASPTGRAPAGRRRRPSCTRSSSSIGRSAGRARKALGRFRLRPENAVARLTTCTRFGPLRR